MSKNNNNKKNSNTKGKNDQGLTFQDWLRQAHIRNYTDVEVQAWRDSEDPMDFR